MKNRLNVLFYGILAGVAIALGGTLFILSSAFIPNDFILDKKLIGSLLFPVGLLLVCFFKLNLYTGKIGIAFRNKKIDKKGLNVFAWLGYILLGNAIGAFLFGLIIYLFTLIDPESVFSLTIKSVGEARVLDFSFNSIFQMSYKSILCGALVYIAIYFFNNLKTIFGKVIGVVVPIAFFVYVGLQHCIANMFYIAAGGAWNLGSMIGLLICILGNSVGALLLDLFVKYDN